MIDNDGCCYIAAFGGRGRLSTFIFYYHRMSTAKFFQYQTEPVETDGLSLTDLGHAFGTEIERDEPKPPQGGA
jgi:hypothetical protein